VCRDARPVAHLLRRGEAGSGDQARPADQRGRDARGRPAALREPPSGLDARAARPTRRGLHERPDTDPVRLVPRHGRSGDRWRPAHDGCLLRRHVQPPAAGAWDDELFVGCRRHAGRVRRERRPGLHVHRRGSGAGRPARQHPQDDRPPAAADQPGRPASGSVDLPAGVCAQLHQGQHGVQRRPDPWAADRLVGQAPGVRDPRRAERQRHPGPVHARDQQRRAGTLPGPHRQARRLDDQQLRHPAVRPLQGRGGTQRDRRAGPQRHEARRSPRRLRPEPPDHLRCCGHRCGGWTVSSGSLSERSNAAV
jgi:hypothetical protein